MKKNDVIEYFGEGSVTVAAKRLGVHRNAIHQWPVDEEGNITSAIVRDHVLAAGVRWNVQQRLAAGKPVAPIEIALAS